MLVCTLLLPTGCVSTQQASDKQPPDIVLLVVSGLRADRPGEKEGPESAFIEALGHKPSHRFVNAYAQSPNAFVSIGSMLTGRYPSAVPMCAPPSFNLDENGRPWCVDIPDDRYTIPEVLSLYGYQAGLVHAGWTVPDSMEKNFHAYVDATDAVVEGDKRGHLGEGIGRRVPTGLQPMLEVARDWWRKSEATPRLLMFAIGELTLAQSLVLTDMGTTDPAKERFVPPLSEGLMSDGEVERSRKLRTTRAETKMHEDRERLSRVYRTGATEIGQYFGALMDFLAEGERPVRFIVVGSYGVSFRDPTRLAGAGNLDFNVHPNQIILHDSIHVPLLVFSNERTLRTRKVSDVVELVDVFPTVANWGGAELPVGLPGEDLFQTENDPYQWGYAELGDMFSIRHKDHFFSFRGQYHGRTSLDPFMTEELEKSVGDARKYSFFHIEDDPFQQHDISKEDEALTREYHKALIAIRQSTGAPAPDKMTEAKIRELRMTDAKGYW